MKRNTPESFWGRVAQSGDCWEWKGWQTADGYGQLSFAGRRQRAHRLAWELTNGPITDGLWVLHRCDNPPCCRPDHLFLGTGADNARDCMAKGRAATGKRNGHYTHPESFARGSAHYSRTNPERLARGDRHGARLHPERLARGERNGGGGKLTEGQVLKILTGLAAHETKASLAARFGISTRMVGLIGDRRKWTHVSIPEEAVQHAAI